MQRRSEVVGKAVEGRFLTVALRLVVVGKAVEAGLLAAAGR